ncbi:UBP25 hydrolase, partial [Oxyruncus cristatus]|nr:UBP25 hydrolase [Oxyruncus cristatus]
HWFTELPPVLTFELSRFEFNQALGRPEKIHNKLEFPPILYLDRYMHKNREITRIKRDEIKRLKEYLTVLQQRLERYLSYGSGPKRFPLVDVLQYALEFASSKPVCTSPVDDLGASAPASGTVPAQTSPSTIEQQGPSSSDVPSTSPVQRSVIHKPFTQSRIPPDLPMHPAPRHITEEELSVLEGCLHRWRTEVENDTRDLQESISRIHRTIELMYSDKTMVQVPYRLHAVLVHEGQANAGHYWAYIYDHHQNRWMKYNDISVTKSTWEELERDSFGGYRNASAYCLMYINDKEQYLIQEEFNKETGQMLVGMDTLPSDLRDYVKEDNKRFEKELEEWDAELAQKAQQEKLLSQIPRAPAPSPAPVQAGEPEYLEQPSRTDISKHLKEDSVQAINKALAEQEDRGPEAIMDMVMLTPNMQGIIMAIGKARNVYDRCGPEAGFFKAIKLEYTRLLKLAQEDPPPECDYRLRHAIVYFIQNQAPKKIIERTLLEQFGDHNLSFDERCRNIMKVAQAKLEMIKPDEVNMEEYERWHQDYRHFRETTMFLMVGLEFFQKKSVFTNSLLDIIYCDRAVGEGMKHRFLLCAEQQFSGVSCSGTWMLHLMLLFLHFSYMEALLYLIYAYQNNKELLSKGPYRGHDEELISHYRRESNLQEKLTDFLPKLLDCSTEIKGFNDPPKLPSYSTHELCERYARIMLSLSRTPADGR